MFHMSCVTCHLIFFFSCSICPLLFLDKVVELVGGGSVIDWTNPYCFSFKDVLIGGTFCHSLSYLALTLESCKGLQDYVGWYSLN